MMVVLQGSDQLRQRVAWALSQILVITPEQINAAFQSESYLNYYDIFVRHAFSDYRSILKEVAYSPMMGEMLSYVNSKSTAFVLWQKGSVSYPDENFAR
jgi:cullin-associated NEDD8-dissociated protein 1